MTINRQTQPMAQTAPHPASACLRQTVYDESAVKPFAGGVWQLALLFDAEDLQITGFRSLERVQPPNIFVGREECNLLKDMDLDAEEILFAGEARAAGQPPETRAASRNGNPLAGAARTSPPALVSEMLPAKLRPGKKLRNPERPAASRALR